MDRRKVVFYQPYCFDGFPRMPLPLMSVARMIDRERFEPVISTRMSRRMRWNGCSAWPQRVRCSSG